MASHRARHPHAPLPSPPAVITANDPQLSRSRRPSAQPPAPSALKPSAVSLADQGRALPHLQDTPSLAPREPEPVPGPLQACRLPGRAHLQLGLARAAPHVWVDWKSRSIPRTLCMSLSSTAGSDTRGLALGHSPFWSQRPQRRADRELLLLKSYE